MKLGRSEVKWEELEILYVLRPTPVEFGVDWLDEYRVNWTPCLIPQFGALQNGINRNSRVRVDVEILEIWASDLKNGIGVQVRQSLDNFLGIPMDDE